MATKIYIAGKITGDSDYKAKFEAAKRGQDSINRSKTFPGIAAAMAVQWAGPSHEVEVQDE